MSDICERIVVHCDDREAALYVATFVAEHQLGDGTIRIALRLPISKLADRRPLTERPVIATLYRLQSASDAHSTYSVTWLPKGDGPTPEFAGALAVENTSRDESCVLMLNGHYTTSESGGALPDATPGRRIARVSARDVLRAIADYVELARAHSEAALAGHRPLASLTS
jgi:hypothetical protein